MDENRMREEVWREASRCCRCGFCDVACQTLDKETPETWGPRGRMTLIGEWLKGNIAGSESFSDKIYSCLQCGRCDIYCPSRIKIKDSVARVRSLFTKNHFTPPRIEVMLSKYREFGNPYASTAQPPYRGINTDEEGDILFFKGCLASTHVVDEVMAAERLLDAMAIPYFEFPQEGCCGYLFEVLGLIDEASEIYRKNVERITNSGARKIITACPSCFRAFREIYPKRFNGFDVQVLYITEPIKDSMEKGGLTTLKRVDLRVSYQDPCGLRGQPRFARQARDLLGRVPGLKFVESGEGLERSRCCGGGSASSILNPSTNRVVRERRIDDFTGINVDVVVSSCPLCIYTLREASKGLPIAADGLSKVLALSSRSLPT